MTIRQIISMSKVQKCKIPSTKTLDGKFKFTLSCALMPKSGMLHGMMQGNSVQEAKQMSGKVLYHRCDAYPMKHLRTDEAIKPGGPVDHAGQLYMIKISHPRELCPKPQFHTTSHLPFLVAENCSRSSIDPSLFISLSPP